MGISIYSYPKNSEAMRRRFTLSARRQAARCLAQKQFHQEHPDAEIRAIIFDETVEIYRVKYEWRVVPEGQASEGVALEDQR
jgi:hypothetical protein